MLGWIVLAGELLLAVLLTAVLLRLRRRDPVGPELERIAERYEADMKRTIKRLLSLFEPIVIVCLGLSVGTIVLLMFLAIMDMQSAAG